MVNMAVTGIGTYASYTNSYGNTQNAGNKTGKAAGQFIEVMACEGGCITGPSTHNDIVSGRRQLVQSLLKRKESYENMG